MTEPTIFRLLLLLYPPRFRAAYGDDVLAAMHERRREIYAPVPRRLRLAAVLLRDAAFSLPRAWWTHGFRHPSLLRFPDQERRTMSILTSDLRYAFRRLVRTPGTAIIAVVAVALGIGLTAAMFSIVNGVILRGLPFEQPHELMALMRINPSEGTSRLLGRQHDYRDILERQTSFESIGAMDQTGGFNVSPPGADPEFVPGIRVTASMFDVLGQAPMLGRAFSEADEQLEAPPVAVIGYRFWQERLDADPQIVGKTVRMDGQETTVLGVMPEGFGFPFNQQLWQPVRLTDQQVERGRGPGLIYVARLRDGVSIQQGQADIDRIMAQLATEHPDTNAGMAMISRPYAYELIGTQVPALLFTMLGAVGMVLVIACANVANLLLARASSRTRETAISSALGANRRRVFFQMLSEAAIIATVGAVLGVGIAKLGIDQFNGALESFPGGPPFWFRISLDPRVLGVVVLLTAAASLLSGVIPALKASGTNAGDILNDGSKGGSSLRIGRLSRMLVLVEVAASCALLVAAGLMIKTVTNYVNEDYAFDTSGLFTSTVILPVDKYPDSDSRQRFVAEFTDEFRSVPGVANATIASDPPVVGFTNGRFEVEGRTYQQDRDYPSSRVVMVDENYFSTLGSTLLAGRDFTASDGPGDQPVMIVDQRFADTHFPGESPLGQRIAVRATSQAGVSERNDDLFYTVVGIAPDLYLDSQLFVIAPAAAYVPIAQRPTTALTLLARTDRGDPLELTQGIQEALARVDPDLPLVTTQTMDGALSNAFTFLSVFAIMFVIFGGAALFLATIGLYGVLSFSVSQRRQEVGLRVALGASPRDVRRLIVGQGLKQIGAGLAIGLLLAFGLGRAMTFLLYDVSASDPVVIGGIVLVLLAAGLMACYVPARRATRVDPLEAMRVE